MEEQSTKKGEAICFTAGPQGTPFGAGVIHAWLVADRDEPTVVTGISTGAVTAAAMQRAMEERGRPGERTEASRWEWFGKYLTDMLDRPLDVIWKALPDPVDYLSATLPVRDLSCPPALLEEERESRYHFWILTKLGKWISGLPVSIGELGRLAVLKVRCEEQIPLPLLGRSSLTKIVRQGKYWLQGAVIGGQVLPALVFHPFFTRTFDRFRAEETGLKKKNGWKMPVRPLFGWQVWMWACLVSVYGMAIPFAVLCWAWFMVTGNRLGAATAGVACLALISIAVVVAATIAKKQSFAEQLRELAEDYRPDATVAPAVKEKWLDRMKGLALGACCIDLHIVSNYQLKRRIWNRFMRPGEQDEPLVGQRMHSDTHLVIVAAALQPLLRKENKAAINHQCWAGDGIKLVDALAAACAKQPLFPIARVRGEEIKKWLREKDRWNFTTEQENGETELNLVDGSVIRSNPLPALFNWLREKDEQHVSVARGLQSDSQADARVHVIYNVPIEPFDAYEGKAPPEQIDLIEAVQVGLLMRARRDTRIEVNQTNYLSALITARKSLGSVSEDLLPIYADEIAPARELKFENSLSPTREEGLRVTAEGCRRTLGRLYSEVIDRHAPQTGQVDCAQLLHVVAPSRRGSSFPRGLPEVCAHCSGRLEAYRVPKPPSLVKRDFGSDDPDALLKKEFRHLCEKKKPRIVFVASGGVFRGAFHIGLLGAMQALDITPDLVVGASVGTLMGGALAAMRHFDDEPRQLQLLSELTETFLHVDETVALTVPLKTAVKQVGLRARGLELSPAKLKAAVQAGTASDVGYASTGVPPMVIDTLSQLFIIPPGETIKAGSDFLAGRFTTAAASLIKLMRTNTLDSLEIRYAVIGTSLLERVARRLMGAAQGIDLDQAQPYLNKDWQAGQKSTAVFCTTAFVNSRWPLLLGRDALSSGAQSFRFVYAGLSSSAFPAAFPARQEAEVFPGTGKVTNLFCDGGMFDNLPFMPAIEILKRTQMLRVLGNKSSADSLRERLNAPDLIISGGFDPLPSMAARQSFRTRAQIKARTSALGAAVKTDSFISMSGAVSRQLRELLRAAEDEGEALPQGVEELMDGAVVAGVVNIVPATELHVNPTFGFSKTLGFDPKRVESSIANGCFQTMRGLVRDSSQQSEEVGRSLTVLGIDVKPREQGSALTKFNCPYFEVDCAFAKASESARSVYSSCTSDPVHQKISSLWSVAAKRKGSDDPPGELPAIDREGEQMPALAAKQAAGRR